MSLSKAGSKGSVLNELVSGKSFSVFKQLMTGAVQIYALSSRYEAIYISADLFPSSYFSQIHQQKSRLIFNDHEVTLARRLGIALRHPAIVAFLD